MVREIHEKIGPTIDTIKERAREESGYLEERLERNLEAMAAAEDPLERASLLGWRSLFLAVQGRQGEAHEVAERALDVIEEGTPAIAHRTTFLYVFGWGLWKAGAPAPAVHLLSELLATLEPFLDHEREAERQGARGFSLLAHRWLALCYDDLGDEEQYRRELETMRRLAQSWDLEAAVKEAEILLELGELDRHDLEDFAGFFSLHDDEEVAEGVELSAGQMEKILQAESDGRDFSELLPELEAAWRGWQPKEPALRRFRAFALKIFENVRPGAAGESIDSTALADEVESLLADVELGFEFSSRALLDFARLFLDLGDRELALAFVHESVDIFEAAVDRLDSDEATRALLDRYGPELYPVAVDMIGRGDGGDPAAAFAMAERGRAWALRQALGSLDGAREWRPAPATPGQKLLEQLENLSALEQRLSREPDPSAPPAAELRAKLAAAREDFAADRRALQLTRLEVERDLRRNSANVSSVQQWLDRETALLAYFAGQQTLWIGLIRRSSFEAIPLEMDSERWHRLLCRISRLRWSSLPAPVRERRGERGASLVSGCGEEPREDPSIALHQELVEPVTAGLEGARRLIIVPFSALHHLPFAALRDPETRRFLVQDFMLGQAPSAGALEELLGRRAVQDAGEILVLGDPTTREPPLLGARREARKVARLFGVEPRLGEGASETSIRTASGIGLLHVAAHGQYTPEHPIFSRLVLAAGGGHDGMLEMHEVWDQLDLRGTRLVTLSGCETALGELTAGDEVMGLTQAFLVAGSRAVVSTLWPVDDEASSALMMRFYAELIDGKEAAEALRAAQLAMLADPRYRSPYYWAGYTLTGDGTTTW